MECTAPKGRYCNSEGGQTRAGIRIALRADNSIAFLGGCRMDLKAIRPRNSKHRAIMARWFDWTAFALFVWGVGYPHPYVVCIIILAVTPIVAIAIVQLSAGRLTLFDHVDDRRPHLFRLWILPPLALALRSHDYDFVNWKEVLPACALVTVLYAIATIITNGQARQNLSLKDQIIGGVAIFLIGLAYGWGLISEANGKLDHSKPIVFHTKVLDKWRGSGKSHSWNLTIEPWGPVKVEDNTDVGRIMYDRTQIGQVVCVSLYKGSLGFQRYTIDSC